MLNTINIGIKVLMTCCINKMKERRDKKQVMR
jgi:hypothetical protein